MGRYKLLSALHRKDWVEAVKQQNKMGFESFMRRRGVELSKASTRHVAIVRPAVRPPRSATFFRGD